MLCKKTPGGSRSKHADSCVCMLVYTETSAEYLRYIGGVPSVKYSYRYTARRREYVFCSHERGQNYIQSNRKTILRRRALSFTFFFRVFTVCQSLTFTTRIPAATTVSSNFEKHTSKYTCKLFSVVRFLRGGRVTAGWTQNASKCYRSTRGMAPPSYNSVGVAFFVLTTCNRTPAVL